jgi:hypothetical protein
VAHYYPDELVLFDIESAVEIDRAVAELKPTRTVRGDAQSRFGGIDLSSAIEDASIAGAYLKLISATVALLKSVGFFSSKSLSGEGLANLQATWQTALENEGIPADRAALIVSRFSADLMRVIAHK